MNRDLQERSYEYRQIKARMEREAVAAVVRPNA